MKISKDEINMEGKKPDKSFLPEISKGCCVFKRIKNYEAT